MPKIALEGWQIKAIDDLVALQYGKSPKDVLSDDGRYPVIGTGGITGYATSYLYDGSTTVIGRKGTINKPSYIEGRFWAIDTTYFATNYNNVDPKWFFYILNSFDLSKYNEASGVPSLGRDTLYAIPLLTPPLPEQQKIAIILSSVDDVIEKTRAQIDKLNDLKTGMMQELLTNGIGHTEFKDSPVGRIPVAWKVSRLEDVATVQTGIAKNSKITGNMINVPYLRVANVQDGYLDLVDIKTISIERSRLERFLLRDEDVLVNEGGDFDKLGRGFIWHNQISPCVHQNHVFAVRTNKIYLLPMFFNYLSGSKHGKKYYLGCAKQTTNLASINSSQLKAFPVLIPKIDEQEKICKILDSIDQKIVLIMSRLTRFNGLKKALMQDLLTGKVRVTIDNKEVAVA